jgi:hypothetical protein
MKHYGVYYIYCKNTWKSIFEEQIRKIHSSNILNKLDKFYLVICFTDINDYNYIVEKTKDVEKIEIASAYKNNVFEFEALRVVKVLCKKHLCKVLYIHTKGAGISEENCNFYQNKNGLDDLLSCVGDWRAFMENELLFNVDYVLDQLNTFDACGVNLTNEPKKHFSGNFWWANSTYINTLPDIKKQNRWDAEFWIGEGNGNFLCLKQNPAAGYRNRLF